MRWKGRQQSENVEDVRGMRPGVKMAGGGGFAVLIIIILAMFFNFEPQPLLDAVEQARANAPQVHASGVDDEYREFISVVLRDNEVVANYLLDLASGLRLDSNTCEQIHRQVGAPSLK